MKEIKLTKGMTAIVDDDDFESLSKYKWGYTPNGYVRRNYRINGRQLSAYMHRQVMGVTSRLEVDHIDGNKLDNRKSNLRICSPGQNSRNQGLKKNESGFKGVSKNGKSWQARIVKNRAVVRLGNFADKRSAAKAYDTAALKLHGKFARTNAMMGL